MAAAMIDDTLDMADRLHHEAGFEPARARAMLRIAADFADKHLATKGDLRDTEARLRTEMREMRLGLEAKTEGVRSDLETKIEGVRTGLKLEIAELRGDIRVLYWMSGTTLAGVAALLGIAIKLALHVTRLG